MADEVPAAAPALPDDASALVPASQRGIILYTVRDATGRDPLTNDGALGLP